MNEPSFEQPPSLALGLDVCQIGCDDETAPMSERSKSRPESARGVSCRGAKQLARARAVTSLAMELGKLTSVDKVTSRTTREEGWTARNTELLKARSNLRSSTRGEFEDEPTAIEKNCDETAKELELDLDANTAVERMAALEMAGAEAPSLLAAAVLPMMVELDQPTAADDAWEDDWI